MTSFSNAGIFLIQTLLDLYLYVMLLRLLLHAVHADYYNPVVQVIIKLTQPIVKPLQKVTPPIKGIDLAVIFWLLVIDFIKLILIVWLESALFPQVIGIIIWTIGDLLNKLFDLYFYIIIIRAIMSWLVPTSHNPTFFVIVQLTEPLLHPARRIMPPISGLDLSPILVLIILQLSKIFISTPLIHLGIGLG